MINENTSANPEETFQFRLYITGASPNSSRAVANVKKILESCIKGQYSLEIIDVYQQPHIAKSVDIIALPLLIRNAPLPEKRAIGDLSDSSRIIQRFELNAW
jgi:circadian clock protein KaiB